MKSTKLPRSVLLIVVGDDFFCVDSRNDCEWRESPGGGGKCQDDIKAEGGSRHGPVDTSARQADVRAIVCCTNNTILD